MINDATASKVTEDIFDEKYGVAGIDLQLKMLMWRAYIARYKVISHQNNSTTCESSVQENYVLVITDGPGSSYKF